MPESKLRYPLELDRILPDKEIEVLVEGERPRKLAGIRAKSAVGRVVNHTLMVAGAVLAEQGQAERIGSGRLRVSIPKEIAEEIAKGVESGLRGKPITMPIVNGPYPRIFQVGVQTEPGRIKMTLPKEVARAHARVVRSERRKRRQGKSAALRESPEELRRFVFGRDPDYTRARRAAHRREQIDKGNYY